mgnify:CR=1 FL=1
MMEWYRKRITFGKNGKIIEKSIEDESDDRTEFIIYPDGEAEYTLYSQKGNTIRIKIISHYYSFSKGIKTDKTIKEIRIIDTNHMAIRSAKFWMVFEKILESE